MKRTGKLLIGMIAAVLLTGCTGQWKGPKETKYMMPWTKGSGLVEVSGIRR
jgi:hypothetical protein